MRIFQKETKEKIKEWVGKIVMLILNPRLLLCLLVAWMITNGWSYVVLGLGIFFRVAWMQALAGGYLALLWVPFTPEKILTVAIAIFLLRVFFPKDEKTLGVLREMREKAKASHRASKERRRTQREERQKKRAERSAAPSEEPKR